MTRYDQLVFGLVWRTAISDDRKELIAYSKELDANCYVEAAFDVKHKYGFCKLKRFDKAQSAAVILGQILESGNGIFVHQINREEHCFIAVRDSLPVEECDIVGTREEVIAAAKAYAEKARKNEGIAPKFFGDLSKDEINGAIPLAITKLIDDGEGIGEIGRVRSLNAKVAFIFAAVLLISGAWFAQDIASLVSPPPPPRIDPATEHRKAVDAVIDSVVALNQFPANVMPGYIKFVTNFPAEVASTVTGKWKLDTLTCDKTDCIATWKREGTATNKDFLQALEIEPGDVSISFPGVDAISRKVTFIKDETPGKLLLGTQLKFGETVMSWLQTLSDKPRTDPLMPMVPLVGNVNVNSADKPMWGGMSFTVPYSELQRVAALPNVITIEKITLVYRDRQNIKFEFQGKYYAL